jgi:recombination protein RecA
VKRKQPESNADYMQVEELAPVTDYLSTGCTLLDLAIADRLPGGFGCGRISHIWGPESSAKSVLVAEPLGAVQRKGGRAYLVDSEGTFDFGRAHLFGVDGNALEYTDNLGENEITVEYLFNNVFSVAEKDALENGIPSAVGIDSMSAIPSDKEAEEDTEKSGYGTGRAQLMSLGFRKHIGALSRSNVSLIFIDQARENLTGMGKKYVFSGGQALRFYASTRVYVEKKGNILNRHKRIVGVEVYFRVEKNKIAPPFREGTFCLLFDYGIDNIQTNLKWLKENDPNISAKSSWFEVPGVSKKFQTIDAAIEYVEKNQLEDELDDAVYSVWRELYEPVERKRRER